MAKRAVITQDDEIVEIKYDRLMEIDINTPNKVDGTPLIHTVTSFEFDKLAFHLNEKFDWVIARDSAGQLLLIPSEKYLN